MASIPLPALDIKTQGEGPLAQYAQLQQIKNAQVGNQLQQTEVQQRQQALADQQATTKAMKEWDGKNPDDLPPLVLKHGGSSTAVFGLKNTILDWKTKAATLDKDQLDNMNKHNEIVAGHFEAVKNADDKQAAYTAATQDLLQKGLAKPGQFPEQYPGDDWLDLQEKQHMGQKAIVEQAQKDKELQQKGQQLDIQTKEFQAKMPGGAQENPEQKYIRLQSQQGQGQQLSDADKSWVAGYEKNKKMVPLLQVGIANNTGAGKPAADVAKQFGMSPEAFDQAAEKYYQSGALPPIGRGAQGPALNKAIMNRTAELHAGQSLAEGSAEYKANAESLKKLQGNLDAVSAFEKTANKNLDLFTSLAQKAINTGIPLLNAPLRSGAKLLAGSEDQLALDAARQVAVNEIAKVTSSPALTGVLSDNARKEVEAFIPENATFGQALKVAKVLRQDMNNRHESYNEQIADIKSRMGGKAGGGSATTNTPARPAGATHTGIGSVDKKKHWLDKDQNDLGVAE